MVIAIGKAAAAMARGAASVLDVAGGVCVTDHPEPVPDTMRLVIGDHPVPGPASLEAGAAVLEAVQKRAFLRWTSSPWCPGAAPLSVRRPGKACPPAFSRR